MTIQNKIWLGVMEIQAGTRTGDIKRSTAGQEIIRQALAEIDAGREAGQLEELNAAAMDMYDIVMGHWPEMGPSSCRAFLEARKRHQNALSILAANVLAEGDANDQK